MLNVIVSKCKMGSVLLLAPSVYEYLAHEQADSDADSNFNHTDGQTKPARVLCCGTLISLRKAASLCDSRLGSMPLRICWMSENNT
jgi:hypothetical protein